VWEHVTSAAHTGELTTTSVVARFHRLSCRYELVGAGSIIVGRKVVELQTIGAILNDFLVSKIMYRPSFAAAREFVAHT
jgi:hypothetical protein